MNQKLTQILFCFLLSFTQLTIFAEHPDSTLSKIDANRKYIQEAAELFNINDKILSSIIFVERRNNYTWEDDALDEYLAQVGLNSSIGFCQVKLKTAYWIEVQFNDSTSSHFPGKEYLNKLKLSENPQQIIERLQLDSLNILYAAAYLRIMISRWAKESSPINDKPEILGTLYSTGLFYRTGEERKPNTQPKANRFGEEVREVYYQKFYKG